MDKLYVVIPAYNEEENIINVINDWYSVVERYNGNGESRLIIFDDGSKDSTYKIMQEYAKSRSLFQPIKKSNSGHGSTVLYGYQYALDHGADYVFQTDSDGQTLPAEFHQFWNLRKEYDMVIGCRSKRQDGLSRIVVTKVLKLVIKLCFGVTVADANAPFRLMKSKVLKDNIALVPKDFNLSNVILSVIYAKKKLKVKSIPITFRVRQGGVNSINLKKICIIGWKAIKDFRIINATLKGI